MSVNKSGASDASGTDASVDVRMVKAVVVALIPEFHQVRVCDGFSNHYALTRATQGIDLALLREGQQLVCAIDDGGARVLRAMAV